MRILIDCLAHYPAFYTVDQAAMPNSYPNTCCKHTDRGGSLYHFYDYRWYDPIEARSHDLLPER